MSRKHPSLVTRDLFRAIKKDLDEANRICANWDYVNNSRDEEDVEQIGVHLEAAYEKAIFLMERLDQPQARLRILEDFEKARRDFADTKYSPSMADPYLIWSYRLSQLLSPVEQLESDTASSLDTLPFVEQILDGFHRSALKMRQRYAQRPPFEIGDEYDVQYLLEALLINIFPDVRREQYTPGLAGVSSRMDFLLKEQSLVVETKMIRKGLSDSQLIKELIVDKAHYQQHPDCKTLVCFVYDPQHLLKNPMALEADLSESSDNFSVRVWIRPKA